MNVKNKKMGLAWLVFSFIFLFNPNFNIIDILPDFIGYIFLCLGLSRLCDMNEDIAVAQKGFSRALVADLLKIGAMLVVFSSQNPEEQGTMLLLISFVFSVVELIILIPAYKAMFGGFIGLGYKFDNVSVLGNAKRRRMNRTETVRLFTYVFLIIKSCAYSLPEFAVLTTQNYDDLSHTNHLYDHIGLLRAFAILVSLVVGVVWLCKIEAYFARIRKDEGFILAIRGDYEQNILPKESIFVRKSVKLMSLFFFAAALLCLDFRLESVNVLVDPLAAIALLLSFFAVRKHIASVKKAIAPFLFYLVASLAAVVTEFKFFAIDKYYYSMIFRSEEAYASYKTMLVFSAVDALGFLFAAFGMCYMLHRIIKEHTGFCAPYASVNLDSKAAIVHKELDVKVYLLFGAAVIAAATDVFYDFNAHSVRFAGLVNTVGTLVFICAVFNVCFAVIDEVEAKYMLE